MLGDQPSWNIQEWYRLADYSNPKDVVGHYAEQLEYIFQKYRWSGTDDRRFTRKEIFEICWFIRENPRIRTIRHGCGITKYNFYKTHDGLMDKASELAKRLNEIFWDDRL